MLTAAIKLYAAKAEGEERWRYCGVGRWVEAEEQWALPALDFATWRALGKGRATQAGRGTGLDRCEFREPRVAVGRYLSNQANPRSRSSPRQKKPSAAAKQ